ncbi:hypothetical protein ACH170_000038 [Escherichia coli]
MKKTLIALAVAASAVVSCSAMASGWEQDSNGSVEFGGTLTPVAKGTPWEVKTGDAVTNLDAQIEKGQTSVEVDVNEAIPVLGIRNADVNGFTGREGIKPQISYNNAVDIDSFYNGVTSLKLSVQDVSGNTIGTMLARFSAAALSSWSSDAWQGSKSLYAGKDTDSFYGGLGKGFGTVLGRNEALKLITALSSDFVAKWKQQGEYNDSGAESFNDSNATFFGVYGAGIEKGKTITIKLNNAVANDDRIQWKASLPVTVTYM